ncbi:phage terminase large subunit family protein [Streptomyces rubiginosohelvolus]|uniref:phage terminase large subunit family protein n=1 Tax=Streptomyces rubiginosohelvolus TaxID=67362 RepID=UPI00339F2CB0
MNAPARYATPRDPRYRTFGGKVAKLGASMGAPFMPWQRQVADVALEVDDAGVYRYGVVVLTVQRRAGKTTLLQPVMAHRGITVKRAGLWVTAQQRQDAADTWADTADAVEDSPLRRVVKRRSANGQECLRFTSTGAKLRVFNALSRVALHGKNSDVVFIDEAFAFTAEQGDVILQAAVPTMATRPGAQLWIVSTAGTAASTWLRDLVKKGRAQAGGPRFAYFEWSIPEDTEDLTDLDVYAAHHPAIGHTISLDALADARSTMKAHEFARAYGNFWVSSDEWAISPVVWDAARTRAPFLPGLPIAFGAEVAADRSGGIICAAGTLADGRTGVEVVEHRGGIGWMAPRLLELSARHRPAAVVIDPGSPAGPVHRAIAEQRKRRGQWVPLAEFGTPELLDANTEFLDGLTGGTLAHRSHERLDAAVRAMGTRMVREQVVFSRLVAEDGTSPAPALAAMLAAHGLAHPVPNEKPALTVASG